MKKIENTALQMIAEASRCPDYGPDMVKSLMKKLDMNEKGFALLMNVAPSTVRLWTSGAAQPCGTAKRLMQIYETRIWISTAYHRERQNRCFFMTKPLCIGFFQPVRRKLRPSQQSLRACGMKITGSLPLHRRI